MTNKIFRMLAVVVAFFLFSCENKISPNAEMISLLATAAQSEYSPGNFI